MTNEPIIKRWRSGLTAMQVAKDYMQEYNKEAKKRKEPSKWHNIARRKNEN